MKTILFVTGTRADYGKLKTLMLNVEESAEFQCHIFATGMHTLKKYGQTSEEIRKAGFKNMFTYTNQDSRYESSMDIILSNTIEGLSRYVHEHPIDMIVVHGDRVEALAGAIVGALNNILVAHIEGGELSGTIDGLIRHSVSKLSHIHFVSNGEAKNRLIQMGENTDSVFVIGSPDIDIMLSDKLPTLNAVKKRYDIPFDEYGIFIYHPVTTEILELEKQIDAIVDAILLMEIHFIIIHPNNDEGTDVIYKRIKRLDGLSYFKIFPSLRFEYFLTLLKNAKVIIGNSSAGIREAPVYGIPTINIGTRQDHRISLPSIVNVEPNATKILSTLPHIQKRFPPLYPFGDGKSAEKFMAIISNGNVWKIPCQKQFQDLA